MPDGWQPAVDNLQSQINSINAEISVLSGQEGAQAAQIASLVSEVSALQTEVSMIQQQVAQGNLLADLSGVSVSNAFDTPSLLSLSGNSVLQMPLSPSVDGKPFRITVLGRVSDSTDNFYGTLLFGNSLSSPTLITSYQSGPIVSGQLFFYELDCFWDSVFQKLFLLQINQFIQQVNTSGNTRGFIANSPSGPIGYAGNQQGFSATTQSSLQFAFSGQWNNAANPASVVLSQFKLSLI